MKDKIAIGWKDGDSFTVFDNGVDSEVGHRFELMCNGCLMLHTDNYGHVLLRLEYETTKDWSTREEAGFDVLVDNERDSEMYHWRR